GHGVHVGRMSSGVSHWASDSLRLQFDAGRARHRHFRGTDTWRMLRRFNRWSSVSGCCRSLGTMLLSPSLANHAEVVWRTGRLHFDATLERAIIEPVQHLLVLFRRNHLFGSDIHAATYRHQ